MPLVWRHKSATPGRLLFCAAFLAAAMSAAGPATAAVPGTPAPATLYQVTLKKAEFCSDQACTTAVLVGSSIKTFDIASAAVGQSVGSYASTNSLVVGQTFSHIRVTISETMTITGTGTDGGVTCFTGTPFQQGDHNTAELKANGGGPAVPEDYVVPARAGDFAGLAAADFTALNIQDRTVSGDVVIVFPLTSPFTVTTVPPVVTVAFGTQQALGVSDQGGNCLLFPMPPTVTITVN